MAKLQGTILASKIVPTDSLDTYATHDDKYGRGGHRSVDTIVERDEISPERRKEGMTVYVKSTKVKYVLEGGLTNEFWLPEASPGSIDLSNYYKKLETYSKAQVDALVAGGGADLSDYYKKAEVESLIGAIPPTDLSEYYKKTEVDAIALDKVDKVSKQALDSNNALRVTGTIVSLYKGDGTFDSITTQDTVYTLPTASETVLGGIKVGTNLSIDANGVLSANDINVSFTEISNKPTNLSGYGITDAYTKTQVDSLIPNISTKQDVLVSGTNIKTINGQSVLGNGDIVISSGGSIINKPVIISPANLTVDYIGAVTSTYNTSSFYVGLQTRVIWECALDANFTNIIDSYEGSNNLTSWTPDVGGLNTLQLFVRTKQISDGHVSDYSDAISFTTPNIFVKTPTISISGNLSELVLTPTISLSAFSVFNGSDTHVSTDYQVVNKATGVVKWESLGNTVDKLSIITGQLDINTNYIFRARFNGKTYGSSSWVEVTGTTKSQGTKGFSVAPTDQPFALLGLAEMTGTKDPASDNYGNYIHANGSIVCWLPKTFYRVGHPDSPRFATYGDNALDMTDVFETEAEANASGYALPRCFINGGKEQPGVFVDKYMNSKDGNSASKSVFGGVPISLAKTAGFTVSNGMTGCTGILADAVVLSKARGERWNCTSAFIYAYLALVSVAQAQAATSTADVAWYDPTGVKNYPKGCNNNALSDVNDTTVVYASAEDSGDANKPKTGATANFAKTTHNGSNNGVADLNGGMFEVTIGITNFGSSATASTAIANDSIYVLKHSTDIATLTAGWNGATDVWGDAANLGNKYDVVTSPHPLGSSTVAVYWGNGTNAVLQNDLSGVNRDVCGFIPKNSSSTSGSGVNLFGNDYLYKQNRQNIVPLACGSWNFWASTGVFLRHFNDNRSYSSNRYGFRASAYFA